MSWRSRPGAWGPNVRRSASQSIEKTVVAARWGNAGQQFGYLPCGGEVHAEERFADLVVPSHVTVGWWFGTPRYAPFFRAEITDVAASAPRAS
jgi:uncharacterized protein DUF6920